MPQPWIAEIDVTDEFARSLIEAQFPELGPIKIEPFGEGWDNSAFLVNCEYIFRFPRRQMAGPLIAAECRLLPLVGRYVPIPVPVPKFLGQPASGYPWEFAGYRRLRGHTASDAELTHDERTRLAIPLARFLRALHSIPTNDALICGATGDTIGRLDMGKRIPLARKMLSRFCEGLPVNAAKLEALLDKAPSDFESRSNTVVHGDLYSRHLLVDGDRKLCGVIDWGDCHVGDRAIDLVPVYTMLPVGARSVFFDVYGAIDDLTSRVACARALYHTLNVLNYARDISDVALERDALSSLRLLAE